MPGHHPLARATALPRVAERLFGRPLAVTEQRLGTIIWALRDRLGVDASALGLSADFDLAGEEAAPRDAFEVVDGVAVVPVQGTLVQRGGHLEAASGILGYDHLQATIERASSAPGARALLLDIDSAGGEFDGALDFADRLRGLREQLPVTALVRDQACSAGYLLASAAGRVLITQGGRVGSIGVIMAHVDKTGLGEQVGLRVTEIFRGAHKADGSPHHALDEDERARLQAYVDAHYELFVQAVARNRGLGADAVRAQESGVFVGADAIAARLADAISTREEAIASLAATRSARPGGGDGVRSRGGRPGKLSARAKTKSGASKRRRSMAGQRRNKVKAGEQLARLLNDLIDERAGEDGERSDVIDEMANAAGIDSGTVNQILNAEINCPPLERLEGFAEVLDASVERLIEAGEADGCDYSPEGAGEGTEAASQTAVVEAMRDAGEIVEACTAAKLPSLAGRLLREGVTGAAAKKRLAAAMETRDVCAAFGREDLSDMMVSRGLGPADARQILEAVAQDGGGIDGKVATPHASSTPQPVIDVNATYAARRTAARAGR